MTRRRAIPVTVFLALLLALFWRTTDPGPRAEPHEMAPATRSDRAAPPRAVAWAAPPPPPEAPAPPDPELAESGLRAVVEAMGEHRVVCPLPEEGAHIGGDGRERTLWPGEWTHSSPHPEGVAGVRRRGEQRGTRLDGTPTYDFGPIETVLRWTTGEDGGVRCVEEPAVVGRARVRVVDEAGAPLAGVHLDEDLDGRGYVSAADGWLEVKVFNGGPLRLTLSFLNEHPWLRDTLTVWPDDEATWVLVEHGEGWSVHEQERLAWASRWFEQEAAARALLRDPALDPALRPGVEAFLADWMMQIPSIERGLTADGRPR